MLLHLRYAQAALMSINVYYILNYGLESCVSKSRTETIFDMNEINMAIYQIKYMENPTNQAD